jgi:hypothetical protein
MAKIANINGNLEWVPVKKGRKTLNFLISKMPTTYCVGH